MTTPEEPPLFERMFLIVQTSTPGLYRIERFWGLVEDTAVFPLNGYLASLEPAYSE